VELIDRLETHGYVRRTRNGGDRRRVFVSLLPRGQRFLERVARNRISELRASGKTLVGAIEALLERGQRNGDNRKKTGKKEERERRV
jgi:DNA-binding MarR family transcriptional regulator